MKCLGIRPASDGAVRLSAAPLLLWSGSSSSHGSRQRVHPSAPASLCAAAARTSTLRSAGLVLTGTAPASSATGLAGGHFILVVRSSQVVSGSNEKKEGGHSASACGPGHCSQSGGTHEPSPGIPSLLPPSFPDRVVAQLEKQRNAQRDAMLRFARRPSADHPPPVTGRAGPVGSRIPSNTERTHGTGCTGLVDSRGSRATRGTPVTRPPRPLVIGLFPWHNRTMPEPTAQSGSSGWPPPATTKYRSCPRPARHRRDTG